MTILNGKNEGDVLGERTDLDSLKEKLSNSMLSGLPLEHPSHDRLRNQIALLEESIVTYKCVRSPQRRIL